MPTYPYRCADCGRETTVQRSIFEAPPLVLQDFEHPSGPEASRVLCHGSFHRVYEAPMTNLGYREAHHTQNERHLFTHRI
jgi:predicted nucleic acid-binding Zn ribbon protein